MTREVNYYTGFINFTFFYQMDIGENIENIRKLLPHGVKLVAVSKYKSIETIKEAWDAGQTVFGENKVWELVEKAALLPGNIEWHFIGHLQTNKVKPLLPVVSMIQSVDSVRLLGEINKEASKIKKIIPCLLQFHIATESTKFGLSIEEAENMLKSDEFKNMQFVRIDGVMGMATFTDNIEHIRMEFNNLRNIFNILREQYFREAANFREISMGMSDDFPLAIECGSTIIRVGTAIFGGR